MDKKYNKNIYLNKISELEMNELIKKINSLINNDETLIFNIVGGKIYKVDDCSINIYDNGKIMIQGKNVVNLVATLKLPYVEYGKEENKQSINLDEYVGCDEVGTGDFFGGCTFAAVYVNKKSIDYLKELKVDDSKKINDESIKKLYPKIIAKCIYSSKVIYPIKYNDLYEKYENMNTIKTYGHNANISKIQTKYIKNFNKRVTIVMDQYCTKAQYVRYLSEISHPINEQVQSIDIYETKAESKYIAVAAASIIARYEFLKMMEELNIQLHKDVKNISCKSIPLGSTNVKQIQSLIEEIKKKGNEDVLKKYIKMNFRFKGKE